MTCLIFLIPIFFGHLYPVQILTIYVRYLFDFHGLFIKVFLSQKEKQKRYKETKATLPHSCEENQGISYLKEKYHCLLF